MPSIAETTETNLLLTRAQAARRLGISIATVRRMEANELAPIVVEASTYFAPKMSRSTPASLTAKSLRWPSKRSKRARPRSKSSSRFASHLRRSRPYKPLGSE